MKLFSNGITQSNYTPDVWSVWQDPIRTLFTAGTGSQAALVSVTHVSSYHFLDNDTRTFRRDESGEDLFEHLRQSRGAGQVRVLFRQGKCPT